MKNLAIKLVFIVSCVFLTRVFYGIPSDIYYILEFVFLIVAVVTLFIRMVSHQLYLTKIDVLSIVICAMTLLSALMAYINFNQPIVVGLVARRDIFLVLSAAALYFYVIRKEKEVLFFETVVFFSKLYLIAIIAINYVYNPESIVGNYGIDNDYVKFFIDYSESLSSYRFKFSFLPVLIVISTFFIETYKVKSVNKFFVIAAFFWLIFLYGGRGLTLGTFIAFLCSYMFFSGISKKILYGMIFSLLIASLLMFFYTNNLLDTRVKGVISALEVVFFTGNNSQITDVSSLSRLIQFNAVYSYIDMTGLIFGLGHLSHSWNNGFESVFGRFHPADLGIIGVIFIYGFIATLIYLAPLGLIFRSLLRNKTKFEVYWFFQLIILTILTGYNVIQPAATIFIFTLIVASKSIIRKKSYINECYFK